MDIGDLVKITEGVDIGEIGIVLSKIPGSAVLTMKNTAKFDGNRAYPNSSLEVLESIESTIEVGDRVRVVLGRDISIGVVVEDCGKRAEVKLDINHPYGMKTFYPKSCLEKIKD